MLKVLIIDDDDIVLLVEGKMLQRCSISANPIAFKGGKAALEYLAEVNDDEDDILILLDINMPQMNGWEFLNQLEELDKKNKIFVIMVTSSIDRYDKEVAQKFKKVIGFVEKPITVDNCQKIKTLEKISEYFD